MGHVIADFSIVSQYSKETQTKNPLFGLVIRFLTWHVIKIFVKDGQNFLKGWMLNQTEATEHLLSLSMGGSESLVGHKAFYEKLIRLFKILRGI